MKSKKYENALNDAMYRAGKDSRITVVETSNGGIGMMVSAGRYAHGKGDPEYAAAALSIESWYKLFHDPKVATTQTDSSEDGFSRSLYGDELK